MKKGVIVVIVVVVVVVLAFVLTRGPKKTANVPENVPEEIQLMDQATVDEMTPEQMQQAAEAIRKAKEAQQGQ